MRSMLVLPTLLGAALLASQAQAQAAGKQVTLEGKFGQVISSQKVKPEVAGAPELAQNVRLDQLTSGDPDWNGATLTLYEHSESFPSYGLYEVYGVLAAPGGDKALVEFAGKWDVVSKDGQFVEAPFQADGKVVGGTGKLEKAGGTVHHAGKVTSAGGTYSLTLDMGS
jgi:hypothetical protein